MIGHLLMVKEPVPGRVKTRLGATLGMGVAAQLYTAFAQDVLVAGKRAGLASVVLYDPPGALGAIRAWLPGADAYLAQPAGGLGQRMRAAFSDGFSTLQGLHGAILTGSDLPDLPQEYLRQAAQGVEEGSVVLCPTRDGGYCLLGVPAGLELPDIFSGMAWSTPQVLEETLARLHASGVEPHLLPTWQDVDDESDLNALRQRLAAGEASAPNTWRILKELGEGGTPFS